MRHGKLGSWPFFLQYDTTVELNTHQRKSHCETHFCHQVPNYSHHFVHFTLSRISNRIQVRIVEVGILGFYSIPKHHVPFFFKYMWIYIAVQHFVMNCPMYIQYVTKYIYGGEAILERTAVELVRTRLIKI